MIHLAVCLSAIFTVAIGNCPLRRPPVKRKRVCASPCTRGEKKKALIWVSLNEPLTNGVLVEDSFVSRRYFTTLLHSTFFFFSPPGLICEYIVVRIVWVQTITSATILEIPAACEKPVDHPLRHTAVHLLGLSLEMYSTCWMWYKETRMALSSHLPAKASHYMSPNASAFIRGLHYVAGRPWPQSSESPYSMSWKIGHFDTILMFSVIRNSHVIAALPLHVAKCGDPFPRKLCHVWVDCLFVFFFFLLLPYILVMCYETDLKMLFKRYVIIKRI